MIHHHSRYATVGVEVESVKRADGSEVRALRIPLYYGRDFIASKHVVNQGERIEQISWRYYQDPEMWWVIAAANPENIYPDRLTGGSVVRVPDATPIR